jgi:hypothetical protein
MGIDSHLSTCVGTQSPKYLEMAQGHISLSEFSSMEDARDLSRWLMSDLSFDGVPLGLIYSTVEHYMRV